METPTDSSIALDLLQIVPSMIALSRIMRRTALDLYTAPIDLGRKLKNASALDEQLGFWRSKIPDKLWLGDEENSDVSLKAKRSTGFAKKQSVVLRLRTHTHGLRE